MGNQFIYLLGIHYAQFPEWWEVKRTKRAAKAKREGRLAADVTHVEGLSGMTCVAPASAILKLLNENSHLRKHYDQIDRNVARQMERGEWPKPEAASACDVASSPAPEPDQG
jgi:hypothetical protein